MRDSLPVCAVKKFVANFLKEKFLRKSVQKTPLVKRVHCGRQKAAAAAAKGRLIDSVIRRVNDCFFREQALSLSDDEHCFSRSRTAR